MSLTPSEMMPLGTKASKFDLFDTITEQNVSLEDIHVKAGLFVMFICNHCPYVKHVNAALVKLANDYKNKISFIAISSNDVVNYPEDHPDRMKEYGETLKYPFPYLYDESQEVAKAYNAVCTPDFFLFDKDLLCVYRGQIDGSRPGNDVLSNARTIRTVFDQLISGEEIDEKQVPSIGCNIKWK
ncbi:MAG: thioredoxin family protein [Bacteroidia bacterium]|nr:thioredoxin family protein [Bacteroidia bacterium]